MARLRNVVILMAAAMLALAAIAAADPGDSPSVGLGLTNGPLFDDIHGIGVKGDVSIPFRENRWAFDIGACYLRGSFKDEDTSSGNTFEEIGTGYSVSATIVRQVRTTSALFYCGSGFQYSSSKVELKITSSPDVESEPYTVFGIKNRIGSRVAISSSETIELFGEAYNVWGWGNYEEGNQKVTQTDIMMGMTFGARVSFGANGT